MAIANSMTDQMGQLSAQLDESRAQLDESRAACGAAEGRAAVAEAEASGLAQRLAALDAAASKGAASQSQQQVTKLARTAITARAHL